VVEKILAAGERLSPDWSVDGTTGYDYMNMASAVLHDPAGGPALGAYWTAVSGRSAEFAVEERAARPEILLRSFSAQLDAAVAAFHALAVSDRSTRDVTAGALRRGLIALLTVFPCYRTYGFGAVPDPDDQTRLDGAVGAAAPLAAAGEDGVLAQIRQWILGGGPGDPALAAEAARRFQQLSAPVTAKAVEDTAFYRFTRLLSRNDVGFTPGEMAVSVARFHHEAATRGRHFPAAMLATASHDHKRGEDVRARLAVLSERAEDWTARAAAWSELNRALSMTIHPADAYALYQTLVGSMPLDLQLGDRVGLGAWAERVGAWQKKALREAKLRSSWAKANDDYEHVCDAFLRAILDPDRSSAFLADLFAFVDDIAPAGAMNGLVQAALKCVVPGVPDIYQGAEFWDFSLVDPDNRRPVDFGVRARALEEGLDVATLMERWRDGRIKQALIRDLLHLRRRHHRLFRAGGHRPVAATGERADHVIAFMREDRNGAVLFVAALRCAADVRGRTRPAPGADWWGHTALTVPALTPPGDQAAFMGARAAGAAADPLLVRDLLADRPFAWRVMRPSDA
jgi:(1->4)-alpha-D-glucan 1-alpha-D-glucosylmutase